VAGLPRPLTLLELGSGAGQKTRYFIEALLRQSPALRYVPIDVSESALQESGQALLADFPRLEVQALAATYEDGLAEFWSARCEPALILWLGSNLGNLDSAAAGQSLRAMAMRTRPDDRLVLGLDLVKPPVVLERAYDDAQGLTAAFNLNLLTRINRELGADFDLASFVHVARWVPELNRIEMHLRSRIDQVVTIRSLQERFSFRAGETIHTESSHKYDLKALAPWLSSVGWSIEKKFVDPFRGFVELLLAPLPPS
jgi:L-histidine N-alpha-methyltransferase